MNRRRPADTQEGGLNLPHLSASSTPTGASTSRGRAERALKELQEGIAGGNCRRELQASPLTTRSRALISGSKHSMPACRDQEQDVQEQDVKASQSHRRAERVV